MGQTEMIQAGVQVEAIGEMVQMIRPLIQKIVRRVRRVPATDHLPEAVQPEVMPQSEAEMPIGHMQVREG